VAAKERGLAKLLKEKVIENKRIKTALPLSIVLSPVLPLGNDKIVDKNQCR